MLAVSSWLQRWWWVLALGAVAASLGTRAVLASPVGRLRVDTALLRLPLIKLLQLIRPQATDKEHDGCKDAVYDKGLKGHIIQLRKIDLIISNVLEVAETRMVHNDQQRKRDLQFPILIGDQYRTPDKRDKMHFKQPVHLVNELSHKDAEYCAYYILVCI